MNENQHPITDEILEREVHGLWIGKELSVIELLTLHSFVKHGYHFNLWLYEPLQTEIPEEVCIRDANEILSKDKIFFYKNKSQYGIGKGSVAGFSDIFRYKLLHDVGGWWVDMDVTCLKPFDVKTPYFFREHHGLLLVGNIMKAPKGSLLMQECYEEAIQKVDENNEDWHKPIDILIEGVKRHKLTGLVYAGVSNSDEWPKIRPFLLHEISVHENWSFIHWCNEAWKNDSLTKSSILYKSTLGGILQSYALLPAKTERDKSRHDQKIRRKMRKDRIMKFFLRIIHKVP